MALLAPECKELGHAGIPFIIARCPLRAPVDAQHAELAFPLRCQPPCKRHDSAQSYTCMHLGTLIVLPCHGCAHPGQQHRMHLLKFFSSAAFIFLACSVLSE